MKLSYDDIIYSRKGEPAVVVGAGPSLNNHKEELIKAQKDGLIKICVNEWFYLFGEDSPPDYLVLASNHPTDSIRAQGLIANKYQFPVFYANSADETPQQWVEDNIHTDWFGYDQRHWEGRNCVEIVGDFAAHLTKDNSRVEDYKRYGNNAIMWDYGRWPYAGLCNTSIVDGQNPCNKVGDASVKPVQEVLQRVSGFDSHYSTGDTVILHAIAFALLMGCNPIYITGMDLDYRAGYASLKSAPPNTDWQTLSKNLINDLRILNESSIIMGTQIINLQKDAWYGQFKHGELS